MLKIENYICRSRSNLFTKKIINIWFNQSYFNIVNTCS